ncbi:MAG: HlyD family type I secretion periplasmic adaptor subunit [Pseudomonadota bacterium]
MFGRDPQADFVNDAAASGRVRGGLGWPLLVLIVLGLAAFLVWAWHHEIEEVTRGAGQVVPSQQIQVIQSLEPALVGAIAVAEGERVEAGQILMQLTDIAADAERGELLRREAALMVERVRLQAEVALDRAPSFPEALERRAGSQVIAELDVLGSRFAQLDGEIRLLSDQLNQKIAALDELMAQRQKLIKVSAPLQEEAELTERLVSTGAVPRIELLRLRSRIAELQGELEVGRAAEPNLRAAIEEAEAAIELAKTGFTLTARQRLARLNIEIEIIRESLRAADDRVTRTELRAPIKGVVNAINVSTIGQVVEPGQPVIEIVPVDDRLEVEVDVLPRDVAFIRPGDRASVKISAYNYLVYGALEGQVVRIGAFTRQADDGRDVFQVTVQTDEFALGNGGDTLPISPGMQATVDIQTGSRSVLSYLLAPVFRMQSEALRER